MENKKLLSQKEYLKKYLSSGKEKKKMKKKKPNLGSKTVKIIDDDIDLKNMRAIEDGEFDIFNNTEDAPQIAGVVDERGPVDFSDKRRWKIITDDGYGDISVTRVEGRDQSPEESDPRSNIAASKSTGNHSVPQDSDCSPPRRSKKYSDSDERRNKKSKKKKRKDSDSGPNRSRSQENDLSPPRRSRKDSDSDEPREKKSKKKKRKDSGSSPAQNRSGSQDSDFSPPRRPRKDSDSDLSPPRNSKVEKKEREKEHISKKRYDSNSRKKFDKRGENSPRDSRHRNYNEKTSRRRFSPSPISQGKNFESNPLSRSRKERDSYRMDKNRDRNNSGEYYRGKNISRQDRGWRDASASPRGRKRNDSVNRNNTHSRKGGNNSDSDLSPPREKKKKSRNQDSDSSPPRPKKKDSQNLGAESRKNTFKNYQLMTAETSGFGKAPILRDKKTGRKRDLAAEAREQEEKDGKRQELEEKYAQWGRGLKQVEDRQQKLDRDLYEMSKPLARYADDADLERELKAQEREGDPMLAYMKRKQVKEGKREPEKPQYNGPSMPNRFGIKPGYRWDGVDRSNGYEKKWFDAQNARKAVQEEAYKWSTADM